MVEIEINGKKIKVDPDSMIIEAADQQGTYIPRFCYHKKLSIAANCRMCLVEIENGRKPVPACATLVAEGMKVWTQSEQAIQAQQAVMSFLLVNHPLDCPICDQAGQCELQDLSMGYGRDVSLFDQAKRSVHSASIGPLVETQMTRCIHCTRCVRFGKEIAGVQELGVTHRGEKAQISTYVAHLMSSELSANVIDICPVGALTAKPSRYTERPWEVYEHPSIAAHDAVGSHIYLHTQELSSGERVIKSVVPRGCTSINETWISDRDRFSYLGLKHSERLQTPKIKGPKGWRSVGWDEALQHVIARLKHHDPEQIAALSSANISTEAAYMMQKCVRGLGSPHLDFRMDQQDFSDQNDAPLNQLPLDFEAVENCDLIVLVGCYLRHELPMLNHRVCKAVANGAKVWVIGPMAWPFNYPIAKMIKTHDIAHALENMDQNILQQAKQALFLTGQYLQSHHEGAYLRTRLRAIAHGCNALVGILSQGANAQGLSLAGLLPHRMPAGQLAKTPGKHARALLQDDPVSMYLLVDVEPELDSAYPAAAMHTLHEAQDVVCMTVFETQAMRDYADVMLPMASFSERAATYINCCGQWQSFSGVIKPPGEAKPLWKIWRVIAQLYGLKGFEYPTVHPIKEALQLQCAKMPWEFSCQGGPIERKQPQHEPQGNVQRVSYKPMHRADPLVRRSLPLQEQNNRFSSAVTLNPKTALRLALQDATWVCAEQGGVSLQLPLIIDAAAADDVAIVALGVPKTAGWGQAAGSIVLTASSTPEETYDVA